MDVYHWVHAGRAPFQQLAKVLDYLWDTELKDYGTCPREGHVFKSLAAVANWLNGSGTELSAADYVRLGETDPQEGWRAGARDDDGFGLEPGHDVIEVRHDSGPPLYSETVGSRYRLEGLSPSVTLTLGWDWELRTLFAQVWRLGDAAAGDGRYALVLTLGSMPGEYSTVGELETALAGYAAIPDELKVRLVADMRRGPADGPESGPAELAARVRVVDPDRRIPYNSVRFLGEFARSVGLRPWFDTEAERRIAARAHVVERWLAAWTPPALANRGGAAEVIEVTPDIAEYGLCPWCGWNDGCVELPAERWVICRAHRVRWCGGRGLSPARGDALIRSAEWFETSEYAAFREVEPLRVERAVSDRVADDPVRRVAVPSRITQLARSGDYLLIDADGTLAVVAPDGTTLTEEAGDDFHDAIGIYFGSGVELAVAMTR